MHQGVVADVEDGARLQRRGSGDAARRRRRCIVVLDGIEDPHNVGAILRTVDAAGADGVVRQSRHAAPLDGAAAKASAGAVAHVKIAEVVNIARAIEELKEAGVWTVGLAGDAPKRYDEIDFTLPTALVVGRGGDRAAAAGPGAVRLAGVDSDARARPEPERVGGGRHRAVRGGPAAPVEMSADRQGWSGGRGRASCQVDRQPRHARLHAWHRTC